MKILVTGGAGYIGSVVVEQLVARGDDVVVLDNFFQGHRKAVLPGVEVLRGDISKDGLGAVFKKVAPEAVIHLAALVSVEESVANPERYHQVNVVGTFNVLDGIREAKIKRVVFASSAAVYGPQKAGAMIKESATLRPDNAYGTGKARGEQMMNAFSLSFDLAACSLRFFNVAGATDAHGEDHDPETHLVPCIIRAALKNEAVPIYGTDWLTEDGTPLRDFVHVSDIAAGIIAGLNVPAGYHVYNLGSGKGYTCLDVVRAIEKASGLAVKVRLMGRRPGDIDGMLASFQRASTELEWKPSRDLQAMADSAWKWAAARPGGYGG